MKVKVGTIIHHFPDTARFLTEPHHIEIEVDPKHLKECQELHPDKTPDEQAALAAYHSHTLPRPRVPLAASLATCQFHESPLIPNRVVRWVVIAWAALVLILLSAILAKAQDVPPGRVGNPTAVFPNNARVPLQTDAAGAVVVTTGNTSLNVAATVNATINTTGLAVGVSSGVSTTGIVGTPAFMSIGTSNPAYVGNTYAPISGDLNGGMRVDCIAGCATPGDTIGTPVTFNTSTSIATVALAGQRGIIATFNNGGSYTGTVVAGISFDGGATYTTAQFTNLIGLGAASTETNPAGSFLILIAGGATNAQVSTNAYTSGSMTVTLRAVTYNPASVLFGQDGTFLRALSTTSTGIMKVDLSGTAANGTAVKVDSSGSTSKLNDGSGNTITSTASALDVNIKSGGATGYAQGSATPGEVGTLIQAAVTTTAPVYVAGQTSPLNMDNTGALRVNAAIGVTQGSTTAGETGMLVQAAASTNAPTYVGGTTNPLNTDLSGDLRVVAPGITFVATPTTLTNGQVGDFQIDNKQALKVVAGDNGFTATAIQPVASQLNATVTGNGTAGSPTVGTLSIQGISGMTAVTVAGTVAISNGSIAITSTSAQTITAVQATGSNLHIQCDSGCTSSSLPADNSAFTAGTTGSSPISGFYHSTRDTLTDNRIGAIALNANRAVISQIEDANKNAWVFAAGGAATVSFLTNTLNVSVGGATVNVQFLTATIPVSLASSVATTCTSSTCTDTVVGAAASGSAMVGNPVLIAGASGTTVQTFVMENGTPVSTDYGLVVRNIPSGTQPVSIGATVNVQFLTAKILVTPDANALVGEGTAASMANGWPVAVGMSSGGTNTALISDPCETSAGIMVSGSINTSMTIVTGTSAKFISICYLYLQVNGNATNWAMVEGTGTLCATNLAGNFGGGTTAATGPNWIANQGGSFGVGRYSLYTETRAADNLCLLLSAANQVNYNLKYVVQ